MGQFTTETILQYNIVKENNDFCVRHIYGWIKHTGHKGKYFICANPHSLEVARKDPGFDLAIRNADLVVPDGVGIVIASRILGGSIRERITGMDIFLGLSEALNKGKGTRYFFLGSTEQNLIKIKEKINDHYPNITVAGMYSPPFKPEFTEEDNKLMVEAINLAKPDVLWVGMTAPKQEKWIYQNKERLNVKFIGAIGAVFDFYTGNVKRSHPFFQRMGLEWLPRLLREPRRLWRRNFISTPLFLFRVFKERISGSYKKEYDQ
jgi:N-acetylglucosaminyldiphosphoundecaprenol N-acetyl-beta-D-mannosaminyltransferase